MSLQDEARQVRVYAFRTLRGTQGLNPQLASVKGTWESIARIHGAQIVEGSDEMVPRHKLDPYGFYRAGSTGA